MRKILSVVLLTFFFLHCPAEETDPKFALLAELISYNCKRGMTFPEFGKESTVIFSSQEEAGGTVRYTAKIHFYLALGQKIKFSSTSTDLTAFDFQVYGNAISYCGVDESFLSEGDGLVPGTNTTNLVDFDATNDDSYIIYIKYTGSAGLSFPDIKVSIE